VQGARYTTVHCHAVDLTCVPPDVSMYALARHWVKGSGFAPALDIETDALGEEGAQVRHAMLLLACCCSCCSCCSCVCC
jgi:hypothetical protein